MFATYFRAKSAILEPLLVRELGVDGLARFLRLNRSGPGDYTADRTQWQQDVTIDQIVDSMHQRSTPRT